MNTNDAKTRGDKGESHRHNQGARSLAPVRRQSLSPFGGTEPFQRLRDEFDRLFDRFLPAWAGGGEVRGQHGWNVDIEETGNSVAVRAEAPGFEPSDFDIQIRGDQLVLRASHDSEADQAERGIREWHNHEFYRSIPLPAGVDSNRVDATYRNGVLSLTMPKTEESKGQRIEVKP